MQDYAHILLYGPPGTGKSELASTLGGPRLIAHFDPIGHATPYLRRYANKQTRDVVMVHGQPSIIETIDSYALADIENGLLRKEAKLQQRLWHFGANLEGKLQFDTKRAVLRQQCEAIGAESFVFDSLTAFTTAMRLLTKDQGISDDEKAAYAITDYIEQLANALGNLSVATVLIAHISDQNVKFRNQIVRKENYINAPGRMARNLKSVFSNVWYCYVDDEGNYLVQTKTIGDHECRNNFNAPALCANVLDTGYKEITKFREPLVWIGADVKRQGEESNEGGSNG